MDRFVSPRVAYWTSAFEPHMEAISAEVALLRRTFPGSVAWGLSRRRWLLCSPSVGYCVHPRLHLLFRLATRLLEPLFDLNHIVGSIGDWFYLEGPRRRPTVLTMAALSTPVPGQLLKRVDRFVVEYPGGRDHLARLGIDAGRVRLIFPPVDLDVFRPAPRPEGPFTVLFASSPDDATWLEARGVPQLLDAAALRPAMRFRLLWRPWGDSLPPVTRWIQERRLHNVEVLPGCHRDMTGHYRQAHVTIAPFTDPFRAKPAPNSVVESLASGRPALVSESVGLAGTIREAGAGLVCPPQGEAIAAGLDRLSAEWEVYAARARRLAEERFGVETFARHHARLYAELRRRRTS